MDAMMILKMLLIILSTSVLGMIAGGFSYFLDYCFYDGSIFSGYLPWLARIVLRLHGKNAPHRDNMMPKDAYDNYCIDHASRFAFYKIFGGCVMCSNVWLCFVSFAILNLTILHFNWLYLFPYVISAHILLRKLKSIE